MIVAGMVVACAGGIGMRPTDERVWPPTAFSAIIIVLNVLNGMFEVASDDTGPIVLLYMRITVAMGVGAPSL